MATYTNITEGDMDALLAPLGFSLVSLPGTRELVYGKRVDQGGHKITLRVYTGIEQGASRECGSDAIRCAMFWRRADGEVLPGAMSKRVHRVQGWKANLTERLSSLQTGPNCPACGSPTFLKTGTYGSFYGCGNFPQCRQTTKVAA